VTIQQHVLVVLFAQDGVERFRHPLVERIERFGAVRPRMNGVRLEARQGTGRLRLDLGGAPALQSAKPDLPQPVDHAQRGPAPRSAVAHVRQQARRERRCLKPRPQRVQQKRSDNELLLLLQPQPL
jgi:hypothetical protein